MKCGGTGRIPGTDSEPHYGLFMVVMLEENVKIPGSGLVPVPSIVCHLTEFKQ